MNTHRHRRRSQALPLAIVLIVVAACFWPGLSGGWLFDDYPNIVDNKWVQPTDGSFAAWLNAALSSPASELKRPLASLSFAANFMMTGLDPFWMKLTNLIIHLANGALVFLLSRSLFQSVATCPSSSDDSFANGKEESRWDIGVSLCIAAAWMLLPINLTGVLYVVQRMESLANLFVLLGLLGYVAGRRRMLHQPSQGRRGFLMCLGSITLPTGMGLLAKETAAMLPLYAFIVEWCLFGFRPNLGSTPNQNPTPGSKDRRLVAMFALVLVLPLLAGLTYLLPSLVQPRTWATKDFTMGTRLLSESRVVVDYIRWTLFPTASDLSFYHDDFDVSTGLLTPWSTLASLMVLTLLVAFTFWSRTRMPMAAMGVALFLASHLLTGTILPLELVYEHRNYFGSLGLLLTLASVLNPSLNPSSWPASARTSWQSDSSRHERWKALAPNALRASALVVCVALMGWWTILTVHTAHAWGSPLRLAEELARRAPESPRAQYELGRTYVIYSHYDPSSPFTPLAYSALERAAALPKSSILPQQAMIFMSARMQQPINDKWWESMIQKLTSRKPGIEDESSLAALAHCARELQCDLPKESMKAAFLAALSHPNPSARLQAIYGDYAWDVLEDRSLGLQMAERAVADAPNEAAYRITLIRRLNAEHRYDEADRELSRLEAGNYGGRLDKSIVELKSQTK